MKNSELLVDYSKLKTRVIVEGLHKGNCVVTAMASSGRCLVCSLINGDVKKVKNRYGGCGLMTKYNDFDVNMYITNDVNVLLDGLSELVLGGPGFMDTYDRNGSRILQKKRHKHDIEVDCYDVSGGFNEAVAGIAAAISVWADCADVKFHDESAFTATETAYGPIIALADEIYDFGIKDTDAIIELFSKVIIAKKKGREDD